MKGLATVARRAIVTRMESDPGITALVAKADVYGQTVRAKHGWPFTRLGPPQTLPLRAACLDGGTVNVAVHAFAKPRYDTSGNMIETAEDHAGRIGAAIERALDCRGETVMVEGVPARLRYTLADMQLMQDAAEADAYHYYATVRARIVAE